MNPNQADNQSQPATNPSVVPSTQPIDGIQRPPSVANSVQPVSAQPFPSQPSVSSPATSAQTIPVNTPNTPLSASPELNQAIKPAAPSSERSRRGSKFKNALPTVLLFILAPAIALSITAFAFQSYQVDGQSMETTLQDHDRLVVSKVARSWSKITHHPYIPKRGNIIIFNQAGLFDSSGNQEKQLIKRVIGLPGERVVVKNGQITVYNKEHPNGFNPDRTTGYTITAPTTPGDTDVTLKENEIFVCGDNRTNSEDSRYFGPVNVDRIVGKLYLRILPINNAEKF